MSKFDAKTELIDCMWGHIKDLQTMIDVREEEIADLKLDLQQKEHKINIATVEDLTNRLKKANTCIDNMTDKLGEIRQLIIDNIITSVASETPDGDTKYETSVVIYESDISKLFKLLEITEDDYLV